MNHAPGMFELQLSAVQFEAVFMKVLQPPAKLRLFRRRELADIRLDLFKSSERIHAVKCKRSNCCRHFLEIHHPAIPIHKRTERTNGAKTTDL